MEEALREAAIDAWREGFARSVAEKRIRAKELLAGEQRRFQELEGELARRLDMLAKQLAQGEAQHHKVVADAQARSAACDERSRSQDERQRELAGREQRVTHMLDDLQRRLSDLQSRQHEVEAASKELHIRQTECAQREADLAKHQAELLVRTEDVVRRKQELDQQQHHLDQSHKSHQADAEALKEKQFECQQLQKDWERLKERVQERELETQKQRRHIAQQLRKRKSEVSKEAELHRAEALASSAGEELQLQMRLSELQAKYEKLRDEVASSGQQTAEANQRVVLLQKQLEAKQKELDTRHKEAGQNLAAREQFEALRRQFDTDKQKLHGEGQKKYDEARKQLEAAQGELAKRRAEAEVKAGELSRLQAELAKRATDLETRTAEVQKSQSELDRVRREMQQQLDTLKSDAAKSQDDQVRSLQGQLDRLRQEYDNDHQLAQQQAGESQRRIKQLEGELTAAKSGGASADESSRELARLRSHNKQLDDALTEALERSRTSAVVSETNQEFEDLRRRFELAVEDVRELKNKNAELSDQLSKAKASGGRIESGAMDWEAQKRRMLEQMEADFDEGDAKQKADKLTVEATIKATDKLLTEKDQELAELKRLLENQSQNVGEVAVGAAAIAAALDGDAIVRQERENLQQLQAKLREEHKKAEVDCSLERAKIARERSELEEKMRQFAAEKASLGAVEPGVGGKGKKGGGKWLERLGLGSDKSK